MYDEFASVWTLLWDFLASIFCREPTHRHRVVHNKMAERVLISGHSLRVACAVEEALCLVLCSPVEVTREDPPHGYTPTVTTRDD